MDRLCHAAAANTMVQAAFTAHELYIYTHIAPAEQVGNRHIPLNLKLISYSLVQVQQQATFCP
jgi:hypothetical protein